MKDSNEQRLFELIGKRVRHIGFKCGIEIEIEGDGTHRPLSDVMREYFLAVNDGSLRNGIEYVSKPLNTDEYPAAVAAYAAYVRKGAFVCSTRCSTHIHVNVQDLTVQQFKAFMYLSLALEPLLMELVPPHRRENVYCMPAYKTTNVHYMYSRMFNQIEKGSITDSRILRSMPKYVGIGLFKLEEYGTVEFRMFPATKQAELLNTFIGVLEEIRETAIHNTVDVLKDIKLTQGIQTLVVKRLGSALGISKETKDQLLELGIRSANDMLLNFEDLTRENLLKIHSTLFPESAPETINPDTFAANCVQAYNNTNLAGFLAKFDKESFKTAYQSIPDPFYKIFCEIRKIVVDIPTAADITTEIQKAYR